MDGIRRRLKVYLPLWLGVALAQFVYILIQKGLPKSFGELALQAVVCVAFAPFVVAFMFSMRLKLYVLAFCLAGLVAMALNAAFQLDIRITLAVAGVLVFAIYRACEESKLVRRVLCAAVVAVVVFPLALVAAALPFAPRLTVALGFAGLGAWAGWWVWPKLAAIRPSSGWSRRRVMKESLAQWRSAAAGDDEISGDDFLRPRR
jgi:hypothetical protein